MPGRSKLDTQKRIHNTLRKLIETSFKHNGVPITQVAMNYEVEHSNHKHHADIAVLTEGGKPLLIIETKKKHEVNGGYRAEQGFHVTTEEVLGQVFSYVAMLRAKGIYVPFVAVANDKQIAVFQVPEDIDRNVNWEAVDKHEYARALSAGYIYSILKPKHMLEYTSLRLSEGFFAGLLDKLTGIYVGRYKPENVKRDPAWILIEELRGFVETLYPFVLDAIATPDGKYRDEWEQKVNSYAEEKGYKPRPEHLAREAIYTLLNKIIIYKTLEKHHENLPKLEPLYIKGYAGTAKQYISKLKDYFSKAVEIADSLEAVFRMGIYDEIEFVESEEVPRLLDWLVTLVEQYGAEKLSELIGYVYEELIPEEERHLLGQFYTPKPIAELIVKWCIRSPDDRVLDPGCGSGTFLLEAYKRLAELKLGEKLSEAKHVPSDVHKQILSQLYGVDINKFPAHLATTNLIMKNPKEPGNTVNMIIDDYFAITPGQRKLVPSTAGSKKQSSLIPKDCDAVVGNPPYTRWTEIPKATRDKILRAHRKTLSKYSLTSRAMWGLGPSMYVYWIIHSTGLLKEKGRLGMIISDSWLQADYGISFGNFLLDHFKVKAVIDIAVRVFPRVLVGSCIVLLEKSSNQKEREDNKAVFMYLDLGENRELAVDEVLDAVENPEKHKNKYYIRVVRQGDIPRDKKWINLLFDASTILDELRKRTIRMEELFEVSRGNTVWSVWGTMHGRGAGLGADGFFYMNEEWVKQYGLWENAYPALVNAGFARWFTFTRDDWEQLKQRGSRCYAFICHKQRRELSENAKRYIEWGETKCTTKTKRTRGGGETCSQSLACREREKRKDLFYGWYDLGGVKESSIFTPSRVQYYHRFTLMEFQVVLDEDFIVLMPKENMSVDKLKALLAYLNSSLAKLYIESQGRPVGGGVIDLDIKYAKEMPILDVRGLGEDDLKLLASLFDELEAEARRLGGADKLENIERLWDTVIKRIDEEVARILGLPREMVNEAKALSKTMMERRRARARARNCFDALGL